MADTCVETNVLDELLQLLKLEQIEENIFRGQSQDLGFGNVYGGLSGPAIKPIALRMVHQTAARVKVPVIGMGGIMSGSDALEFLIAGAKAVEVGTANFVDPDAAPRILREIGAYCERERIAKIADIVGTLRRP